MWIVGVLSGREFRPIDGAPSFQSESLAAAWARRELAANRIALKAVRELVTWRAA